MSTPMEITPELLAGFLDEAPEYLDMLDVGLMELEGRASSGRLVLDRPEDREQMNTMFRAAHSLKGLAAAFGFQKIKELTHRMETLFDQVRMMKRDLAAESFDTLFRVFDRLKALVRELTDENNPKVQIDDILEALDRVLAERPTSEPAKSDGHPMTESHPPAATVQPTVPLDTAAATTSAPVPAPVGEIFGDPEMAKLFVDTAIEAADALNEGLLQLERNPGNTELVNDIFRAAHNIKGAAGAAGLSSMHRLTHQMETVLDQLRSGRLTLNEELTSLLLQGTDALRNSLDLIRQGRIDDGACGKMLDTFSKRNESSAGGLSLPQARTDGSQAPSEARSLTCETGAGSAEDFQEENLPVEFLITVTFAKDFAEAPIQSYLIYNKLNELGTVQQSVPDMDSLGADTSVDCVVFTVRSELPAQRIESILGSYSVEKVTVVAVDREGNGAIAATETKKAVAVQGPTSLDANQTQPIDNRSSEADPAPALAVGDPEIKRDPGEVSKIPSRAPANSGSVTSASKSIQRTESTENSADRATAKQPDAPATKATETLRVDQERLDQLMNLGGELVINRARFVQIHWRFRELFEGNNLGYLVDDMTDRFTRLSDQVEQIRAQKLMTRDVDDLGNQLLHLRESFGVVRNLVQRVHGVRPVMYDFDQALHALNRVTEGLQKGIMGTRMVPIGPTFGRFKRVVRDLAKSCGKSIELVLRGETTEMDKRMIDELADPLTHMVRNSVDHGIEMPEDRKAKGKDPTATVVLEALHRGNSIWIEISDDGAGVNLDRVKAKAVERGLVTQAQAESMNDKDVIQFVMQPGFSTAPVVTDLSGRGMGMDIVKSKIEKLSGTVEIESVQGKGTRVVIKLPLTLAIITSMVARLGEGVYALPLEAVVEIITVRRADIQSIQRRRVVRVRERIVPVVTLEQVFGSTLPELQTHSKSGDELTLVIVGFQNDQMGLIVDSLLGQEDVVIKSIAENYRNVKGIAGASIRGDGTVSLILDVAAMMEMAARTASVEIVNATEPAMAGV
ncbi:MAG: chemotaxis protein CheA [Planctomycetota bacterium]